MGSFGAANTGIVVASPLQFFICFSSVGSEDNTTPFCFLMCVSGWVCECVSMSECLCLYIRANVYVFNQYDAKDYIHVRNNNSAQ